MIAYIKGTVEEILEDRVILETGNMGYNIFMPMGAVEHLLHKGQEIKIHTYLNVKEEALQLFGFLTRDDLNTFAVLADDVKTISRAPGIGKKTAQKLILELKDKFNIQEALEMKAEHVQMPGTGETDLTDMKKEAVEALTALGYSGADALRAVKKVELTPDMSVEILLKLALKNMF